MTDMEAENRRRVYLRALDIDVYALRGNSEIEPPPADAPDATDSAAAEVADVESVDWATLEQAVPACTQCALYKTRTQTVFGVGRRTADWMIIGDAPGAEEDQRGEPFVGRAGKLLDEMLRALGLQRNSVFITNILKCRPPEDRDSAADEAESCRRYLERQIELISPKIVLAVGPIAVQNLLQTDAPLGCLRQQKHYLSDGQRPVVVTYHPDYLLRSPTLKRKAWEDLCFAQRVINETSQ